MNYHMGQIVEYRTWQKVWIECELIVLYRPGRWEIRAKRGAIMTCPEHCLRPRSALIELAEAAE